MKIVFLEIIRAMMSNGLGVLSKLMVDVSPDRQSDRDGGTQFVNNLYARSDSPACSASGVDAVTPGVLNAV